MKRKIDIEDFILKTIITKKHKDLIEDYILYNIKVETYIDIDNETNNKLLYIKFIGIYYEIEHCFDIREILLCKYDILSHFIEKNVQEIQNKDNEFIKHQEEIYYD